MNTNRLKSVVKYAYRMAKNILLAYSRYRPQTCDNCDYAKPMARLPLGSTHPGRGMWLCSSCIYGGRQSGPVLIGHVPTPLHAMEFRDSTRTPDIHHGYNADLASIWCKRTKLVQSECRPSRRDEE